MSDCEYRQIKAKCLDCGLHFVICTEHPDQHGAKTIYCPECGQHDGNYVVWHERVSGRPRCYGCGSTRLELVSEFIFETVPGKAVIMLGGGV